LTFVARLFASLSSHVQLYTTILLNTLRHDK
jgi:hypothetical protein